MLEEWLDQFNDVIVLILLVTFSGHSIIIVLSLRKIGCAPILLHYVGTWYTINCDMCLIYNQIIFSCVVLKSIQCVYNRNTFYYIIKLLFMYFYTIQ